MPPVENDDQIAVRDAYCLRVGAAPVPFNRRSTFEPSITVIDRDGFRPNVGIILLNATGEVFWGKRAGHRSWQFPQGGINDDERPLSAMYRELEEETGLLPTHVEVIGWTHGWLRYRLPKNMIRRHLVPTCIGQKQKWFLLRLRAGDGAFNLNATEKPEFDGWEWRPYWSILDEVVYFKRGVYREAMLFLADAAGVTPPPAELMDQPDDYCPKETAHAR